MNNVNALIELSFRLTERLVTAVISLEDEPAFRRVPAFGLRVANTAATLLADVGAAAGSARSQDYRVRVEAGASFRAARSTLGQLRNDLRMFDSPTFPRQGAVCEMLDLCEELLPVLLAVSIALRGTGGSLVA